MQFALTFHWFCLYTNNRFHDTCAANRLYMFNKCISINRYMYNFPIYENFYTEPFILKSYQVHIDSKGKCIARFLSQNDKLSHTAAW